MSLKQAGSSTQVYAKWADNGDRCVPEVTIKLKSEYVRHSDTCAQPLIKQFSKQLFQ